MSSRLQRRARHLLLARSLLRIADFVSADFQHIGNAMCERLNESMTTTTPNSKPLNWFTFDRFEFCQSLLLPLCAFQCLSSAKMAPLGRGSASAQRGVNPDGLSGSGRLPFGRRLPPRRAINAPATSSPPLVGCDKFAPEPNCVHV